MRRLGRSAKHLAVLLGALFISTTPWWQRRFAAAALDEVTVNLASGTYTVALPPGAAPEDTAVAFVAQHGIVSGGGCAGDGACVA